MKRVHQSLLTAVLVFGIGGGSLTWVYLRDLSQRDVRSAESERARRLFTFSPEDVTGGRIFARSATISFVKRGSTWRLTEPVDAAADAEALEAAITRMSKILADPVEGAAGAAAMATYELDHPVAWMEVETSSGASRLIVGAKNALDERYFVTDLARARAYLTDPGFFWSLDRSLEAFREHRLLPLGRKEVTAIVAEAPGGLDWKLAFDGGKSRWMITDRDGRTLEADDGEVHLLIVALTDRLRAEHFLSEEVPPEGGPGLARFGLDRFVRRFELSTRSGEVARMRLALRSETAAEENKKPVAWVEGSRSLIEVPSWAPRDLSKRFDDLRNRVVSRFDRDAARRLELESGAQKFAFEREGADGKWRLMPGKRPAHEWIPAAILLTTSRLKADTVEKDAASPEDFRAYGLEPPRRRILVLDAEGKALADVRLGRRTGPGEILVGDAGRRLVGRYGTRLDDLFPESETNLLEVAQ